MKRLLAVFLLVLSGCRGSLPLTFEHPGGPDRAGLAELAPAVTAVQEFWDNGQRYHADDGDMSAFAPPH